MPLNCFLIDKALQLTPMAPEAAAAEYRSTDTTVWLDLQGEEPNLLEEVLDKLEVSDICRRLCLEGRDLSGSIPSRGRFFL